MYVGLTREGLDRRRLQSEAEPDRLIGVNAVFIVADPACGVAVKQADAQNQTVAVVYQLERSLGVGRLPVLVALGIKAETAFPSPSQSSVLNGIAQS